MSILDHLDELRTRAVRALLGILAGVGVALAFIEPIRTFVMAPTVAVLPPGATLIYTNPVEGFAVHLQIAFIAGATFASPIVMFQIWRFIRRGWKPAKSDSRRPLSSCPPAD